MRLLFFVSTFVLSTSCFSQTFYESPFVVNGTSFRFTVPPGYEEILKKENYFSQDANATVYSPSSLLKAVVPFDLSRPMLSFSVSDRDSSELYKSPFLELFTFYYDTSEIQFEPFVTSRNDTFLVAQGLESLIFPELQYSIAITTFDSVSVLVRFSDATYSKKEYIDDSFFEAVLKSFQVYETDRESTFFREEYLEGRSFDH